MQARRAARRLALDILYEAEIRDATPLEALELRVAEGWVVPGAGDAEEQSAALDVTEPTDEMLAFARRLVTGVQEHRPDIDSLIDDYADRWPIERMPVIDRNVLRMALYELFWTKDVPVAVAINEAVELAKSFSTDDSGRFVNGLLGRIVETRQPR